MIAAMVHPNGFNKPISDVADMSLSDIKHWLDAMREYGNLVNEHGRNEHG
jgi:hypothetical protein